jgi:hypothetical protein
MPALFRQDCTDGRQGGRVQLELLDGRAECKGFERGRCDSTAVSDASYIDVRSFVNIVCSVNYLIIRFAIVRPSNVAMELLVSLGVWHFCEHAGNRIRHRPIAARDSTSSDFENS